MKQARAILGGAAVIDHELKKVCDVFETDIESIMKPRTRCLARLAAYWHLTTNCNIPKGKVAKKLGVTRSAVNIGAKRFEAYITNNDALRTKLLELQQT